MNTPLHPHAISNHSSTTIANAALARNPSLASSFNLANSRTVPNVPVAGMQPLTNHASLVANQRARESSAGSESKRRRLQGGPGALTGPLSNLARNSSAGPSVLTPKERTPGASSSRGGSAVPARTKKIARKVAPGKKLKVGPGKKAGRRLHPDGKKLYGVGSRTMMEPAMTVVRMTVLMEATMKKATTVHCTVLVET